MSITKQLNKTLGGKWTYDGRATWWCDDNKRSVSRCGQLIDPEWSEDTRREYWLYGNGTPVRAEQYMRKNVTCSWLTKLKLRNC
jgi:hypothetical protein